MPLILPWIRSLFRIPPWRRRRRRGSDSADEYGAYVRSRGVFRQVLDWVGDFGGGALLSVALAVLGALWVFQNELLLGAAKNVMKRLKGLSVKVQSGTGEVGDEDLRDLEGWRWRVISGER